jgi:hypothetical protein
MSKAECAGIVAPTKEEPEAAWTIDGAMYCPACGRAVIRRAGADPRNADSIVNAQIDAAPVWPPTPWDERGPLSPGDYCDGRELIDGQWVAGRGCAWGPDGSAPEELTGGEGGDDDTERDADRVEEAETETTDAVIALRDTVLRARDALRWGMPLDLDRLLSEIDAGAVAIVGHALNLGAVAGKLADGGAESSRARARTRDAIRAVAESVRTATAREILSSRGRLVAEILGAVEK